MRSTALHPSFVVRATGAALLALTLACAPGDTEPASGGDLASVASFASITDDAERAAALFSEASKVLTHPRCMNCHPSGDSPFQGDRSRPHQPVVRRGADGFGGPGLRCPACHQAANFDPGRVPGAPHWHLAPAEMAWEGLTVGEICARIKDPAHNGERDLEALVEHMSHDALVAWAWQPGRGRTPAPGDQASFAALITAWAEAGAACP